MTRVIPTAKPATLFIKGPPVPEDLARTLAERGFYVFGGGSVGQFDMGLKTSIAPTARDVVKGQGIPL